MQPLQMLINKQELLLEGLAFLSHLPRLLDFTLPINQKLSVAQRPDQMVDYLSRQLARVRVHPVSPFQDILGN